MSCSRLIRIVIALAIALFVIVISAVAGSDIFIVNVPEYELNTYFTDCQSYVINRLTSYSDKAKLNEYGEAKGADAIVTLSEYTQVDEDKYNENIVGCSPIVAIFPSAISDSNKVKDNFSTIAIDTSHNYYMTDMERIINELINSEAGEIDLGKLGYEVKEKNSIVNLALPDNGCYYRRSVVDSIIYLITGGKDVTEENAEQVRQSLDKILSNSIELKNPTQNLRGLDGSIVMLPEFMISNENNSYIYPIYWSNCYATPLKLYILNTVDPIASENIVSMIQSDTNLLSKCGVRATKAKSYINSTIRYADSISTRTGQSNLEELLGSNYWK